MTSTSLLGAVQALQARVRALEQNRVEAAQWATVTQADPLRIRLDGDPAPLLLTPVSLVTGLRIGDRVHVRKRQGDAPLIMGALDGTAVIGDTDWVALTPAEGITGNIAYLAAGGWCTVIGQPYGTFAVGTTTVAVCPVQPTFPTGTVGWFRGGVYFPGGYTGVAQIGPDGTINVANQSGAARSYAGFSLIYPTSG